MSVPPDDHFQQDSVIQLASLSPQQQIELAHHLLNINTPNHESIPLSIAPSVSTSTIRGPMGQVDRRLTDDLPTVPPYRPVDISSNFLDVPRVPSASTSLNSNPSEQFHSVQGSPSLLLSSSRSLATGRIFPPGSYYSSRPRNNILSSPLPNRSTPPPADLATLSPLNVSSLNRSLPDIPTSPMSVHSQVLQSPSPMTPSQVPVPSSPSDSLSSLNLNALLYTPVMDRPSDNRLPFSNLMHMASREGTPRSQIFNSPLPPRNRLPSHTSNSFYYDNPDVFSSPTDVRPRNNIPSPLGRFVNATSIQGNHMHQNFVSQGNNMPSAHISQGNSPTHQSRQSVVMMPDPFINSNSSNSTFSPGSFMNVSSFQSPKALAAQPAFFLPQQRVTLPSTKDIPLLKDATTWSAWYDSVYNYLTNLGVFNHICPPTAQSTTVVDPQFIPTYPPELFGDASAAEIAYHNSWWAEDGIASHIVTSRLSDDVRASLPKANASRAERLSARAAFNVLQELYGQGDYVSTSIAVEKLRTLSFPSEDAKDAIVYIRTWRKFYNTMDATVHMPDLRLLLQYFSDGLDRSVTSYSCIYDDIQVSLQNHPRVQLPSLLFLFERVNTIAVSLQRTQLRDKAIAKSTPKKSSNNPDSKSSSKQPPKTPRAICEHCGKPGHLKKTCFAPGGPREGDRDAVIAELNAARTSSKNSGSHVFAATSQPQPKASNNQKEGVSKPAQASSTNKSPSTVATQGHIQDILCKL